MPHSSAVAAAVQRDLDRLAELDEDLATSGLAASALVLAGILDGEASPTSKSMCAKALLDTLDRIRELAPVSEEADDLDDLAARRAARLSGLTGT